MLVRNVMQRKVKTVDHLVRVLEVVEIMNRERIGSVIVLYDEKPVGIITKRDLLTKCLAECINPCDMIAEDILAEPLITISPDETIDKCLFILLEKGISKLPVMENGELVGIVSAKDILIALGIGKKASKGELEVERQ